jgi:GntR family transcriptional regulator / MocR family aminotransferase
MTKRNATQVVQWERLFGLAQSSNLPLQAQLRQVIVSTIMEGTLKPGAAMPSSRGLASRLSLSRNTVTSTYQQLIDDDFLEAKPRSGIFVSMKVASSTGNVAPTRKKPPLTASEHAPNWVVRVQRSLREKPTISKPPNWNQYEYPFVYGTYDTALFPTDDFRECCSKTLARSQLSHWTPDLDTDDVPELIEQIRTRLLPKRGVFAVSDEILITVGAQHAYYLLAETLLNEHTRIGMEEPGYPHARNIFALRQASIVSLPVDEQGIVLNNKHASQHSLQDIDYVFATPSHQSPTTATLSLERRETLLQQAQRHDFIIIEDDYEAENLYHGQPMPALKSLDKTGRVIYIGSVSKSLSPALRLGYIVAPRVLIDELRLIRHAMVRHPSAFLQHAYALFLSLGHHETHTRRVNQAMQKRLDAAMQALQEHLPDCTYARPQGGASIWIHAPAWLDANELAVIAREHGVLIENGDVFFAQAPYPCNYFRLRLSSIAEAKIAGGIKALSNAMDELAKTRGESRAF